MNKGLILALLATTSLSIFWEKSSTAAPFHPHPPSNQCGVAPKSFDSFATDTSDLNVIPVCQEPLYFDPPLDQEIFPEDGILYEKLVESYRYLLCSLECDIRMNSIFPVSKPRYLQTSGTRPPAGAIRGNTFNNQRGLHCFSWSQGSRSGTFCSKNPNGRRLLMHLEEKYHMSAPRQFKSSFTPGREVCTSFAPVESSNVDNLEKDYRRILRSFSNREVVFGVFTKNLRNLQKYFPTPLTICKKNCVIPNNINLCPENVFEYFPLCAVGKTCPFESDLMLTKTCATTPTTYNFCLNPTPSFSSKKESSHSDWHN